MLHIIDIEMAIDHSIIRLAKSRALPVTVHKTGDTFLAAISKKRTLDVAGECAMLDFESTGAVEKVLFDTLTMRDIMRRLPVIFMINHGDIRLVSERIRREAFDFIEKPFNPQKTMDRIDDALFVSRYMNASTTIQSRLASLSAREREVLELILEGYMNKVIGEKLGISTRTVEAHRAKIFQKTNVKNAMELARFLR